MTWKPLRCWPSQSRSEITSSPPTMTAAVAHRCCGAPPRYSSTELPDAHVVDEHVGRVGAARGVTAAGSCDREIQDREQRVARGVERPVRQGTRGHVEIRLR